MSFDDSMIECTNMNVFEFQDQRTMMNDGGWQVKNQSSKAENPSDNKASHYLDHEKAPLPRLQLEKTNTGNIQEDITLANFKTPSQGDIAMGIDQPPPTSETKKQKVRFRDDLVAVHEVERVNKEDEGNYWMSAGDYDRIATELKTTDFCRENQEKGTIAFAEAGNAMRGLEYLDLEMRRRRGLAQCKHHWSVLKEIDRQTVSYGKVADWDQVRKTSEQHSAASKRHAIERGRRDEEAMRCASVVVKTIPNDATKEQKKEQTEKKRVLHFRQTKQDELAHRWTKGKITDEAVVVTCIPSNGKTKMKKKISLFSWLHK